MITALILACTISAPTDGYVVEVPLSVVVALEPARAQPVRGIIKRTAGGFRRLLQVRPVRGIREARLERRAARARGK